jgi:hypothetical protein
MDQEDFASAKLGQRHGSAVRDTGQREIRVRLADARRITRTVTWRSGQTKCSASQHQQAQVLHRSQHTALHDSPLSPAGKRDVGDTILVSGRVIDLARRIG